MVRRHIARIAGARKAKPSRRGPGKLPDLARALSAGLVGAPNPYWGIRGTRTACKRSYAVKFFALIGTRIAKRKAKTSRFNAHLFFAAVACTYSRGLQWRRRRASSAQSTIIAPGLTRQRPLSIAWRRCWERGSCAEMFSELCFSPFSCRRFRLKLSIAARRRPSRHSLSRPTARTSRPFPGRDENTIYLKTWLAPCTAAGRRRRSPIKRATGNLRRLNRKLLTGPLAKARPSAPPRRLAAFNRESMTSSRVTCPRRAQTLKRSSKAA